MTTEINDEIHAIRNRLAEEIAEHIIMSLKRNGIIVSESFVTSIHCLVDQSIEIKLNS